MSGIAVFNRAVSQFQNSQKNLMAISEARKKLEQDQEMFGLKKKKMELEIETARKEGRMTDLQADALEAQTKTYLQQEQDKMKGKIASVKVAQQENATLADKAMQWAKIGFRSDPQGVTAFLQARDRNAARTMELRPKMSAGKIGYETVDLQEEEADAEDKASIRESRALDIQRKKKDLEGDGEGGYSQAEIRTAEKIAENDWDETIPYEQKLKNALPKAREALGRKSSGKIASEKKFDAKTEAKIEKNMKAYGKSREEVIKALKRKNLIIMN